MILGFNRNIVECKAGKESGLEVVRQVLIETLWNVKADFPPRSAGQQ